MAEELKCLIKKPTKTENVCSFVFVWTDRQTCEAVQEQLAGALAGTLVEVGNHRQGKLLFIKRMTADDAEVIQANLGHRVERNQHISAHFFNRLQKKQTHKGVRQIWRKKKPSDAISDFF